jgi:hypothetical protein
MIGEPAQVADVSFLVAGWKSLSSTRNFVMEG